MAKKKFDLDAIMEAGSDAHLTDNFVNISVGQEIEGEKFEYLKVEDVEANPLQPRKMINELELRELASNIELHGLIQPISVIKVSDKKLILLAGQRRLLAHKLLKKEKIKAIVREDERFTNLKELDWLNDTTITKVLFEISVSENDSREPLTPLDLALSIDEVLKKGAYKTINEVANVLGKSKTYITKIYSTLRLAKPILEDLAKTRGVGHIEALYELQKIENQELQVDLYKQLKAGDINIDNIKAHSVKKTKLNKNIYDFKISKNNVTLKINTKSLSDEKKEAMNSKLQMIIDEYVKIQ